MPTYEGLTPKQQNFVRHYIQTGNGTQSVYKAGYKPHNVDVAKSIACENLTKPYIKSIIDNKMNQNKISVDRVLNKLSDKMESEDEAISLKATELAGKHLRMFREQVDHLHVLETVKSIGWSKRKAAKDEVIEVIPTEEK